MKKRLMGLVMIASFIATAAIAPMAHADIIDPNNACDYTLNPDWCGGML